MTAVCNLEELADRSAIKFDIDGVAVSVVRVGDELYALSALGDLVSL